MVGLAKPTTYMNRSGEAVRALTRAYQTDLSYLLVVIDDINLPLGTIRLRSQGSAGGHNGVQDIIDHLGTDAFARLRIGIGNDFPPGYQADYVLSPFSAEERPQVDETVVLARDAVLTFVTDGIGRAMNLHNRKQE
jgi:PTH1 family peptidyl-tRNA hydrolase